MRVLIVLGACSCWSKADENVDLDGDGFGQKDCDDDDPNVHPNADEVCDGIDNDCDGTIDQGDPAYIDTDGDWREGTLSTELCVPDRRGKAYDCDENNPDIHDHMVEIADGIDNDCDGDIDEPGTPDWYTWGPTTTAGMGSDFAVSRVDSSKWATTGQGPVGADDGRLVGYVPSSDGTLNEVAPEAYHGWGVGAAWWDDAFWVAGIRGAQRNVDLLQVEDGLANTQALFFSPQMIYHLALRETETGLDLAAGLAKSVYLLSGVDALASADLDEASVLTIEYDDPLMVLGNRVSVGDDFTGDGIGELVVGGYRHPKKYSSDFAYVFDGTQRGTLTLEDADVVIESSPTPELRPCGDLDGDGLTDLMVDAWVYLSPLPAQSEIDKADIYFGGELVGAYSLIGDEQVDVVSALAFHELISIHQGPFEAGTYDIEEGDVMIPYVYPELIAVADIDNDGANEIVASDPSWLHYIDADQSKPKPEGNGLLVAFDIDTMEY